MDEENESESPGWHAIDAALAPIYGDRQPLHWAAVPHYRLGGDNPIDGLSAYSRDEPTPHWHFVTYGCSELYQKERQDPAISGWGFELTLRLTRQIDEERPPNWSLNFLRNLGKYVFTTQNPFGAGHYMDLNGPIEVGSDTEIRAIVFAPDPELPARDTPNGRLEFLQVYGITLDELEAVKQWNADALLSIFREKDRLLITNLARPSIVREPHIAERVAEGSRRDGSSSGALFIQVARFKLTRIRSSLSITFGANGVRDLPHLLPRRIPFGRDLIVQSAEALIAFKPGPTVTWQRVGKNCLDFTLTPEAALALAGAIVPKAGQYTIPGIARFSLVIEKSMIRDAEGKVVREIG